MALSANGMKTELMDENQTQIKNYTNILNDETQCPDNTSNDLNIVIIGTMNPNEQYTEGYYFVDEEGRYYYQPENIQVQEQKEDHNSTVHDDVLNEIEDISNDSDYEGQAPPLKRRKYKSLQFLCEYCKYSSPRRYLLLRHMKSHSDARPHKCSICERGFKTVASLHNHINTHKGIKPHPCKDCQMRFTSSGELVRHVRYKHTKEKPHKCAVCDYASVELSKLRRHVRCHTGERPYQCQHCTYASPDTFKLKRHLRTHTGEKPYQCCYCSLTFTQSNSLKSHLKIHDAKAPLYACELCPTKCGRKADLRVHMKKLHSSDRPLQCKRCKRAFPDRYSLKIHTRSHKGDVFGCDICPYTSSALRHVQSHMLKHTDQKPFACKECDSSFRQKQLLKRHENLYHNPDYVPTPPRKKTHKCGECDRLYAHKGNLARHHLAVHDPNSGYQERALALKLGRQKKMEFINAELSNQGKSSNEEEECEIYTVTTDVEGHEVIYVENCKEMPNGQIFQVNYNKEYECATVIEKFKPKLELHTVKNIKSEIENCFGFDDSN